MSSTFSTTRRYFLTFAIAALLALGAAYTPIALDALAGSSLTTAAYACTHSGGGC